MVRAMYGVQLKDRKRSKDLMLIVGLLNEAMDQFAMANCVPLCCGERLIMS